MGRMAEDDGTDNGLRKPNTKRARQPMTAIVTGLVPETLELCRTPALADGEYLVVVPKAFHLDIGYCGIHENGADGGKLSEQIGHRLESQVMAPGLPARHRRRTRTHKRIEYQVAGIRTDFDQLLHKRERLLRWMAATDFVVGVITHVDAFLLGYKVKRLGLVLSQVHAMFPATAPIGLVQTGQGIPLDHRQRIAVGKTPRPGLANEVPSVLAGAEHIEGSTGFENPEAFAEHLGNENVVVEGVKLIPVAKGLGRRHDPVRLTCGNRHDHQ